MVLASEMIVQAAMLDGVFATAIPQFGFERRGSPVTASVRIDQNPIRKRPRYTHELHRGERRNSFEFCGCVRRAAGRVHHGAQQRQGTLHLALPEQVALLGVLDATKIALEVLGIPVTNTAMIGAFAQTTQWISVASALEGVKNVLPPELADKNVRAARQAAKELRIIDRKITKP